jgi:thioredoxin-like negative regulator of GroEL
LLLFAAVAGGTFVIGQAVRWFSAKRRAEVCAAASFTPCDTGEPRVLLFTGPGCSACERQNAIIDDVRGHWPGGLCVERVDTSENPVEARAFGVMSVPTTFIISGDGRIASQLDGLVRADELEERLREA